MVLGEEINHFFTGNPKEGISASDTVTVSAGQTLTLGVDAVHCLSTGGQTRSQALHVYLGNLGAQTRSLYDPNTGQAVAFSEENYFKLAIHTGDAGS